MRPCSHLRHAFVRPAVLALALLPAAVALEARPQAPAQQAVPAPVPAPVQAGPAVIARFPRAVNPIALRGPARPGRYMEASGHKAAFLGREDGSFEAWVYPVKVLHDFSLSFGVAAYADPIPGASLVSDVDVRPEASHRAVLARVVHGRRDVAGAARRAGGPRAARRVDFRAAHRGREVPDRLEADVARRAWRPGTATGTALSRRTSRVKAAGRRRR